MLREFQNHIFGDPYSTFSPCPRYLSYSAGDRPGFFSVYYSALGFSTAPQTPPSRGVVESLIISSVERAETSTRDVYMLMILTCRRRHTPMGADRIGGPLHHDRDSNGTTQRLRCTSGDLRCATHHIPQPTLILHPQDHLHITYLGPMQAGGLERIVECGGKGSTAERERSVCVCV